VAPLQIVVVEDEDALRHAIVASLTDQGYAVTDFADALDPAAISAVPADLAILDVMVPGLNGFELAARLQSQRDIPVMFLTARDALDDRLAGFDLGADDYVVKPVAMAELVARVKAVMRRSGQISAETITIDDVVIDTEQPDVRRGGQRLDLTVTEWRLLVHLAENRGRVLSKTQLLTHVWGYDAYDPNLVEVHVSALRRKLEANGPRLLHTVRGLGYRMGAQ
jgi:DNA-binding response OmpR family regulator